MAAGKEELPPPIAIVSGMISSNAEKYVPMMSDEYLTNMLTHIRDEIDLWIHGPQEDQTLNHKESLKSHQEELKEL